MLKLDPSDQVLRSSLFADFEDWMVHGFGTRLTAPDWPAQTATLKQIHSCGVIGVHQPFSGELGPGDALITETPGVSVSIRTADCVPLLFADPRRRVVAAVHAGWRGTAGRISSGVVAMMISDFGSAANDIRAVIGPAIGRCCYEVSEDVAMQFREHLPQDWTGGKVNLDLASINRAQLLAAGLIETNIDAQPMCTRCDPEGLYHSFRRDGERSGRMHAVIGVR